MEAELKGTPCGTSAPIHRCGRTRELPKQTATVVGVLVSHVLCAAGTVGRTHAQGCAALPLSTAHAFRRQWCKVHIMHSKCMI